MFDTLDTVRKITGGLKNHRAKMKGGTIDDAQLKTMKALIDGARAEIRRSEKQIEQLDAELDKAGARTIGAYCKDKTLKDMVFMMLKQANLGAAN
jgi:hypothetical protein